MFLCQCVPKKKTLAVPHRVAIRRGGGVESIIMVFFTVGLYLPLLLTRAQPSHGLRSTCYHSWQCRDWIADWLEVSRLVMARYAKIAGSPLPSPSQFCPHVHLHVHVVYISPLKWALRVHKGKVVVIGCFTLNLERHFHSMEGNRRICHNDFRPFKHENRICSLTTNNSTHMLFCCELNCSLLLDNLAKKHLHHHHLSTSQSKLLSLWQW